MQRTSWKEVRNPHTASEARNDEATLYLQCSVCYWLLGCGNLLLLVQQESLNQYMPDSAGLQIWPISGQFRAKALLTVVLVVVDGLRNDISQGLQSLTTCAITVLTAQQSGTTLITPNLDMQ